MILLLALIGGAIALAFLLILASYVVIGIIGLHYDPPHGDAIWPD